MFQARIGTLPDPMCARQAMALMVEGYEGKEVKLEKEKNKVGLKLWTMQAANAYSRSLTLPFKGDVGEVGMGLYMLMCGDKIRLRVDSSLRTFSIPLASFLMIVTIG